MELNTDRIDEAVLALLYLGIHNGSEPYRSHNFRGNAA